jgi:hypothetical protein
MRQDKFSGFLCPDLRTDDQGLKPGQKIRILQSKPAGHVFALRRQARLDVASRETAVNIVIGLPMADEVEHKTPVDC